MKISERTWALLGKLGAAAVTALTIILIYLQITDTLRRPDVVAVFHQRTNTLSPKYRLELQDGVSRKALLQLVQDAEKRGESATKILEAVKKRIEPDSPDLRLAFLDFESTTNSAAWHVAVTNSSNEAAKDVRLILPGSGKADLSEGRLGAFDMKKPPVEWKRELSLGTLAPNATIDALLWPDDALYLTFYGLNAGIVHDKGSGVVRQAHEFYGWDADLVAWFLAQSQVSRYLMAAGLFVALTVVMWFLRKQGFIGLRRQPIADPSK